MNNDWCYGPHWDPHVLQSYLASLGDLETGIRPWHQVRVVRLSLLLYQPQSAFSLFNVYLIVVSITIVCEFLEFYVCRSILVSLPLLHIVRVHTVAPSSSTYVSSPACRSKPLTLLAICFVLTVNILIFRSWRLGDCCNDVLLASWLALSQLRSLLPGQTLSLV